MTILLYVNNAASTLLTNITPTDTGLALPSGHGARFPSPATGQAFRLTIEDKTGNIEIVEVTKRANDVLTIVRGREGTLAKAFTAGDVVEARVTAGILQYLDFQAAAGQPSGSVVLDSDAMVPASVLSKGVKAVGDTLYNPILGFNPVQRGGVANMQDRKTYFGKSSQINSYLAAVDGEATHQIISNVAGLVAFGAGSAAKLQTGAAEDDLFLGGTGGYLYGNGTAYGIYHPTYGSRFSVTIASGRTDVSGPFFIAGVSPSMPGHQHGFGDIPGLQDNLNSKFNVSGGGINGDVYVAGYVSANAVYDRSDERIKSDITDMTVADAEAIVRGIQAKRFFNKGTDRYEFGFTAQQVQGPAPEMISEQFGLLQVAYQRMVAPLTKVVQNLLTERDMVQHRLDVLEGKNG